MQWIGFFLLMMSISSWSQTSDKPLPKLSTCLPCHNEKGVGTSPDMPNLGGQGKTYLFRSLHAFKTGKRKNPVMNQIAADLSDADMLSLAHYFSKQPPSRGAVAEKYVVPGRKLYLGGKKDVPACAGCHSPTGLGNHEAVVPRLSGQQINYIEKSLKDFRSGERSDSRGMMPVISHNLSDEEIMTVSHYVNGLED